MANQSYKSLRDKPYHIVSDVLNFVTSEPATPNKGDKYLNTTAGASSATAQVLTAFDVVTWNGTDWTVESLQGGEFVYNENGEVRYTFDGTALVPFGGALSAQTLTDAAGTITWDTSLGENASITIASTGRTITATNITAGMFYALVVNGNSQFSLDTMFKMPDGAAMAGYTPKFAGVTNLTFFSPDGVKLVFLGDAGITSEGSGGYTTNGLIIDNETGEGKLSSNGTASFLALLNANSFTSVQEQGFINQNIASLSFSPRQRVSWTASDNTNRTITSVTGFNTSLSSPYMIKFRNTGTLPVTFTIPAEFKKTDGTTNVGTVIVAAGTEEYHMFMPEQRTAGTVLRRIYPADPGGVVIQTLTDAASIAWDGALGTYAILNYNTVDGLLQNITNPVDGQLYILNVKNTGVQRHLYFDTKYRFNSGAAISTQGGISVGNGSTTLLITYDGLNDRFIIANGLGLVGVYGYGVSNGGTITLGDVQEGNSVNYVTTLPNAGTATATIAAPSTRFFAGLDGRFKSVYFTLVGSTVDTIYTFSSYWKNLDNTSFGNITVPAGERKTYLFYSYTSEGVNISVTPDLTPSLKPVTSATYTLLSDDDIISLDSTSNAINVTFPITLPDGKFYTIQYVQTSNQITFTAGAGTTIVDPSSYTPVASFVLPGSVGQYGTTNFFKVGTVWNFVG
jgi:hypothetical protein